MIAKDIPLSLYVHIPWCEKKCPYCDFNSHILLKSIPEKDYVVSLFKDIDEDKNLTSGRKIKTIFFGGGTPSLFSASSIEKIIEYVDKSFGIDSNAEITLESNPSSSEKEKFKNFPVLNQMHQIKFGLRKSKGKYICLLAVSYTHLTLPTNVQV